MGVGFLIGPGGQTLRTIKETSQAKIVIDQDGKNKGYSIIRIGDAGSPENYKAKELIDEKIKECQNVQQSRTKATKIAQGEGWMEQSAQLELPPPPPAPP